MDAVPSDVSVHEELATGRGGTSVSEGERKEPIVFRKGDIVRRDEA